MAASISLSVEDLLDELERMPAQQAAAVRVLYVADDPSSSAPDLAAAVGADPVLTAQVMRLANSAYYGLSGRIRSADFAVTVVGFATVRSIAASFAAGALGDGAVTPKGFWMHAAAASAGVALVAPRMKVARSEAFSLGLLHDLGAALLCRIDSDRFRSVEDKAPSIDSRASMILERRSFGVDHATAGSTVLTSWRFPDEIVQAIATHHEVIEANPTPLQAALHAGHALAALAEFDNYSRYEANKRLPRLKDSLKLGEVDPETAWDLSRQVRAEAGAIAASFGGSGPIGPPPAA